MYASNGIINSSTTLTTAPIYRVTGCQVGCEQSKYLLNHYHFLAVVQETGTASASANVFRQTAVILSGIAGSNTLNHIYQINDKPLLTKADFCDAKVMQNERRNYAKAEHWFNIWISLALISGENTDKQPTSAAPNDRAVSKTYRKWLIFVYNVWPTTPKIADRVYLSGLDPPDARS